MKLLFSLTISLYKLIIELVFLISRPLLWLILPLYRYRDALKVPSFRNDHPILLHCASVGELNAVSPLIRNMLDRGMPMHLNIVTVSGRETAQQSFPDTPADLAPLDVASLRRAQLKALSPRLILVVETEIWPMLMDCAASMDIPLVFINARMSAKSFAAYQIYSALLRFLARGVRMVLAQSEEDYRRFQNLLQLETIIAGNLKFCLKLPEHDPCYLRRAFGFSAEDLILVWGSSRPKEEALLLSIFPKLRVKYPQLKVILAPRHPKRCYEVEKLLQCIDYQKLSEVDKKNIPDLLLIDSLGHLSEAYAIADIAIVGGSFYDFGGHNPLEPAFYGKAIIIGNHHQSCKASVKKLLENNAIIVSDSIKLETDIISMLDDLDLRNQMGKRAKIVLTENADALHNHVQGIEKCI